MSSVKKRVFVLLILLMSITFQLFSAELYYKIGDKGPAGGTVFYDCDADNDSGNEDGLISSECGWKYLEVAPEDIKVGKKTNRFPFGYYKKQTTGLLLVNGTSEYNRGDCTRAEIGSGKRNTELLVNAMGEAAIIDTFFFDTTANYAAKLCADYEYGGFDDWFLPSIGELMLIEGLGSYPTHWSSTEEADNWGTKYALSGGYKYKTEESRETNCAVRAIRAFSPESSDNFEYSIGSYGPAKGYVFYDKGGTKAEFYIRHDYDFGDVVMYNYVNMNTRTEFGTGKENTRLLVSAMGDEAISSIGRFYYTSELTDELFKKQISDNVITTSKYAANQCNIATINGFDDWFFPSLEELILIRDNLYKANKADSLFKQFSKNNLKFWSSSEFEEAGQKNPRIYYLDFDKYYNNNKYSVDYYNVVHDILLIRAF